MVFIRQNRLLKKKLYVPGTKSIWLNQYNNDISVKFIFMRLVMFKSFGNILEFWWCSYPFQYVIVYLILLEVKFCTPWLYDFIENVKTLKENQ